MNLVINAGEAIPPQTDGRIEIATRGIGRTETAKDVVAGHRLYGNVEGQLMYAYDMKAMGQELQPHLWAQLQRVE